MLSRLKAPFGAKLNFSSLAAVQQGALLFAASSGSSFFNFLYHFLVGRLLGPEHYATLAALIGVLNTVSTPANLGQLIMSDMTARLMTVDAPGQVKHLLIRITGGLLIAAAIGVLALTGWRRELSGWMNLASAEGIVLLAIAIACASLAPIFLGALQGGQQFKALSLATLLAGLLRLVAGVALVWLGFGVSGALSGFVVASIGVIGIALIALRGLLRARQAPATMGITAIARFSLQATLATAAFAVLTSSDVVFARRFFTPEEAGLYSAAATLGKVVLFLPGPIATLMFPKSSARHIAGIARGPVLLKSALATVFLSLGVVAVLLAWPNRIVELLYGSAYARAGQWLGAYGFAALGMALVYLFMLHYLAAHDHRFTWLLCGFVGAQVIALNVVALDPGGFLVVLLAVSWGILLCAEVWLGGLRGRDLIPKITKRR